MSYTYTKASHSCSTRGIEYFPTVFQNEVMTLAPLDVGKLMTKVSMEDSGLWGPIELGNTDGVGRSIRVVELESSHLFRSGIRKRGLLNREK